MPIRYKSETPNKWIMRRMTFFENTGILVHSVVISTRTDFRISENFCRVRTSDIRFGQEIGISYLNLPILRAFKNVIISMIHLSGV